MSLLSLESLELMSLDSLVDAESLLELESLAELESPLWLVPLLLLESPLLEELLDGVLSPEQPAKANEARANRAIKDFFFSPLLLPPLFVKQEINKDRRTVRSTGMLYCNKRRRQQGSLHHCLEGRRS